MGLLIGADSIATIVIFGFIAVVALVMLVVVFVFVQTISVPWMRCFTNGAPIGMADLLAMKMRKTKLDDILPHGIAAAQAGHPIPWRELEGAHLQGVDLQKVTTAYVTARKREMGLTFQELVDADRESRLEEMFDA